MFGIPDTIMYLVGGFLLKDQFSKKEPAPQPAPQAPPAQLMPWQAPQGPQTMGAFSPGMPVEVQSRRPVGPVALDAHIEPHTEEGVWKCLSETNIEAARQFAVSLAQHGLPVAAGVVSYHVHMLTQVRAAQEAQAAQVRAAQDAAKATAQTAPSYAEAPPPAAPERKPRAARNGVPVVVEGEPPTPFEPKPSNP